MRATNCPNPVRGKALFNSKTNDLLPLPCGLWSCPVCGPAKSWRLGTLAAHSWPERWITLSKTSRDVRGAYKALTGLSRSLRRRGYEWEYLAVPERHKRIPFYHLHLLQRGSFVPQRELSQLAERAGMGRIVHIKAIDVGDSMNSVAKYLVKYITKELDQNPPGTRRYSSSKGYWPDGGSKTAFESKVFPKGGGDWDVVHLASAEIRGDDGTILWMGGTKGDLDARL